MALIQDHYVVNIARTREPETFAPPEYEHHFRVEFPAGRTKKEALEGFKELKDKYLEPEYRVSLISVTCRGSLVRG